MHPRTYAELKPILAARAQAVGLSTSDSRLLTTVNRALEILWPSTNIPGIEDQYIFRVYDRTFTLPADLEVVTGINVNGAPYKIRSEWFEFMQSGSGRNSEDNEWVDNIIVDRGLVPIQFPIPDPDTYTYSAWIEGELDERDSSDARPVATVKYLDENGKLVRTARDSGSYEDGEELEINGDTSPYQTALSSNVSEIKSFSKPVTQGEVKLYVNDGTTDTLLATYGARETVPQYRKYYISDVKVGESTEVLVRARKKFVPIREDGDILIISDPNILVPTIQAISYLDDGEPQNFASYMSIAAAQLKMQGQQHMATGNSPLITFADDAFHGGVMEDIY